VIPAFSPEDLELIMDAEKDSSSPPDFQVPFPPSLSREDGNLLIQIALHSIQGRLGMPVGEAPIPGEGPLQAPAGSFVSIYNGDTLRGCLGILNPQEPLWQVVRDIAQAAATRDPRFEPISEREYRELSVEVSVLGQLTPVPRVSPERIPSLIRVGDHGLLIRHDGRSGLLLPQVPVKYGWDSRHFLEEVCFKAGLARDTWQRDDIELLAFRCAIFRGKAG